MSAQPILNPELPYVGEVEDGLTPGKMVKVQGKVPPESTRFAINYQLGPTLNPRDDIALHVSPRFHDGFVTRNHIKSMTWGPEENEGPMWIQPGTDFEIIILCEYECYKIAINGRHFTEFAHRLPYSQVTHLVIDGEVEVTAIFFETIPVGPKPTAPLSDETDIAVGPPPPGHIYPMLYPHGRPREDAPSNPNDYKNHPPRRYEEEPEDAMGDCLDKVGLAVGGLVAAGGVAAALHAMNKNKNKHSDEPSHEKSESTQNESGLGGLGALGAALASSLASNALMGDRALHAQQGYPPQESNMLGSILGALGGNQSGYQQPANDPLGGTLGSILGGVLGGGGHQQQPQYQPSGGYNNYPQNQNSQGNDLLSGIGGALFKTAMDGLSKRSHRSHQNHEDSNVPYNSAPQPSVNYGSHDSNVQQSHASPAVSKGERLTAAEISRGLGLSDDEE
ncbi:PREDICTED: uncharacterized protein LOC105360997 [Ceratosolen solmsi marchali]|uniref:Galectin n=1 Tax=Ceratosolen solmsi marchali TaxID=326594 RepID=A0AAJ6YE46_9HYME|nr:PREDICTED: uncharacterized protein LOC105360997 [Ceratosolen solmsi marchali]